jgi:RES domain-containing protein
LSQTLWRIATDAPAYEAHDLSGKGAEMTGGRWNARDTPAIYASFTQALACLETVVHLGAGGLPLNRYLVRVDVSDAVWAQAETVDLTALAVGWDAAPPGKVSIDLGTAWLTSLRSPLLIVPSAIVPDEHNVLINPRHPAIVGVTAAKVRKWLYDPRLTRPG